MRTLLLTLVLLLPVPGLAYDHPGWIDLYGDSRARGTDPATSIPTQWMARHPWRPMVNDGAGGRTTIGALRHLRAHLRAVRPQVVVVFLDINDWGFAHLPPERTARNLLRLARIARAHDTEVYVLSTTPNANPDADAFTARVEQLEQQWSPIPRVHAIPMRSLLWPTFADFAPYTIDGTHLNAAGNARVVTLLESVLPPPH